MARLHPKKWRSSGKKAQPHTVWLSYALLFTTLWTMPPVLHYIRQAERGHPLDQHYFWAELSPQKVLHFGLYNGPGGKQWKIGQPITNFWEGSQPRSLPELRQFALTVLNRDRQLNNLPPLVENPHLSQAAQFHAQDMMQRHYFSHESPEGSTPTKRFHTLGGNPKIGIGENIIYVREPSLSLTYGDVESFQKGWMYSNGHRANIMTRDYVEFGFGVVFDPHSGRKFAVQQFALPAPVALAN